MRYSCIFFLILLVPGCAPRVLSSGPHGVTIEPIMMAPDMQKVYELADAECAKYNRIAVRPPGLRSSSDARRSVGWALPDARLPVPRNDISAIPPIRDVRIPQTRRLGRSNFGNLRNSGMSESVSIRFLCGDRPAEIEAAPDYEWPVLLPQSIP